MVADLRWRATCPLYRPLDEAVQYAVGAHEDWGKQTADREAREIPLLGTPPGCTRLHR